MEAGGVLSDWFDTISTSCSLLWPPIDLATCFFSRTFIIQVPLDVQRTNTQAGTQFWILLNRIRAMYTSNVQTATKQHVAKIDSANVPNHFALVRQKMAYNVSMWLDKQLVTAVRLFALYQSLLKLCTWLYFCYLLGHTYIKLHISNGNCSYIIYYVMFLLWMIHLIKDKLVILSCFLTDLLIFNFTHSSHMKLVTIIEFISGIWLLQRRRTRMVGPARVLRTIYSRPSFINYRSEVSLEKSIFVDSPKAESYPVIPLVSGSAESYGVESGSRLTQWLVPSHMMW